MTSIFIAHLSRMVMWIIVITFCPLSWSVRCSLTSNISPETIAQNRNTPFDGPWKEEDVSHICANEVCSPCLPKYRTYKGETKKSLTKSRTINGNVFMCSIMIMCVDLFLHQLKKGPKVKGSRSPGINSLTCRKFLKNQ